MLDINLKVKFNLNNKEELAGEIINLPEQGWTVMFPEQTKAVSEIERLIEVPIRYIYYYLHIPCTSGIWPPTKSLDDLVRVINLIGFGIIFSKPVSFPVVTLNSVETNFYVTYNGLRGKLKRILLLKDIYYVIFRDHQNEVVPEIEKVIGQSLIEVCDSADIPYIEESTEMYWPLTETLDDTIKLIQHINKKLS